MLTSNTFKVVCKLNAPLLWLEMLVLLWQHVIFRYGVFDDPLSFFQDHA